MADRKTPSQGCSLWTAQYKPNVLGDLELDLTKIVSVEEFKRRQESCKHEMQRFGPPYTARYDGTYNKFDASICLKCGYSPTSSV